MAVYLPCEKKRNAPRMDVRICEYKCEQKGNCSQFQAYLKSIVSMPVGDQTSQGKPLSSPE